MAEIPYLLDSNVLLRWVRPDHSGYPTIVSAIDEILRQDAVLCYASLNLAEFWNVRTRPVDRNGYRLSPDETDHRARWFEERIRSLPETQSVHEEWRKLLVTYQI